MREFPSYRSCRLSCAVSVATLLTATAACHQNRPDTNRIVKEAAGSTVFTDSAKHAKLCEPPRAGEDWRKVCIPLDQSFAPKPKP